MRPRSHVVRARHARVCPRVHVALLFKKTAIGSQTPHEDGCEDLANYLREFQRLSDVSARRIQDDLRIAQVILRVNRQKSAQPQRVAWLNFA
jgi:hypothetical protein